MGRKTACNLEERVVYMAGGSIWWPEVSKRHFLLLLPQRPWVAKRKQSYMTAGKTETAVGSQRSTETPKYQNRSTSTPKTLVSTLHSHCQASAVPVCVSGRRFNSLTTPNVPNRVFLTQTVRAGLCHVGETISSYASSSSEKAFWLCFSGPEGLSFSFLLFFPI